MQEESRQIRGIGLLIAAFILVVVGFLLLLDIDYNILPFLAIPRVEALRVGLITLVVVGTVWIVLWLMGRLFERMVFSRVGSHAQVRSIWKLISYAVWALVLIVLVLGLVGDVTSTALSVGLLGAALAFALQKPLLNVAGWMFITYHRLIRIGDRVSIGTTKGYVLDIRLMHLELMEIGEWMSGDTYTGRVVLIPNGIVFEGPVHNYTRDSPFIWDEVVNLVTYESDIDVAKSHMVEAANEVIGSIMKENFERYRRNITIRDLDVELLKEPEIRMEFQDSGVNLYVLYWCPVAIRRRVKAEIVERIWRKFSADQRVGIAYPHMEIVKRAQS